MITTVWSMYCQLSSIISIYIAFVQIDLCLVRLAADILANAFTLSMYLGSKTYDPQQYSLLQGHAQPQPQAHESTSATELMSVVT